MSKLVITHKAKEKLIKARAGDIHLPKVVGVAFGSGGTDLGGVVINPVSTKNALNHELLRKECTHEHPFSNTCIYTCKLNHDELVGAEISELALYDEDGDLVAIKNFQPKRKIEGAEMVFSIEDSF